MEVGITWLSCLVVEAVRDFERGDGKFGGGKGSRRGRGAIYT